MRKRQKGQSTIEYLLMVAAAILVFVVFLGPNGVMRQRVEVALNDSMDMMDSMVDSINTDGWD